MTKMTKMKPIRALDIVPGKVYMARMGHGSRPNVWEPCLVLCDETHGWQRGFVQVAHGQLWPMATVIFLEKQMNTASQYRQVYLKKVGDEFVFSDNFGAASLTHVPKNWAQNAMQRVQAELDTLNARMEFLTQIHILTGDQQHEL